MLANITEAMRRGDFATALKTARTLVAAEPGNATAQHLFGVCLRHAGDLAGARVALEKAIALAPDHSALHFSLASLDLAEGRAEAAEAGLKQSLQLDPNQLGAYVTLLHLAMARRDFDEAERNLRLAQRVNPNHPQVMVAEGQLAHVRGNPDLALRCFTAAVEADPRLHEAQLALGKAYLARETWPFAEQALANALSLDPQRSLGTLRSLAQARHRQGNVDGTLQVLNEIVQRSPGDLEMRAVRAELMVGTGRGPQALPDLMALLAQKPDNVPTLSVAVQLLAGAGRLDEARDLSEAALAKSPAVDELWMIRLDLSGRLEEDAKAVLDRWHAANPESPAGLEMQANYFLARGDMAQAEAWADRALALRPLLLASGLVKIQAHLVKDPEQALAQAERMIAGTAPANTEILRDLNGWAGLALDALGRYDQAAQRWRHVITHDIRQMPPPKLSPAPADVEGEIEGTLVWAPVGVRAEAALMAIAGAIGPRLRLDRLSAPEPGDGFGLMRWPPGTPEAGTAARWNAATLEKGQTPAEVVDFVPHLDGYTLAALRGARVLALLTDPRDALLNWMVYGSVQQYAVSPDPAVATEWLASSLEALADHRDAHPGHVVLARLDGDAAQAAEAIETLLSLSAPLPSIKGNAPQFPSGHWRKYAGEFTAEFARLAPVAVRLGYPLS